LTLTPPRQNKTNKQKDLKFQDIVQKYGTVDNFDYLKLVANNFHLNVDR
jgi:hypothetical protein